MEPIRVHTLRLHRPLPQLPMAAQPWVEDALRCASVPGRWHNRWVLVRRMRLRLGARADASAVSRALSAQWHQLAARAQPAEQASAQAMAVWFEDEPAARLALLVRVLQGQPTEAWFWQQVLPRQGTSADVVQALLARPWRQPVTAARADAFHSQARRLLRRAHGAESTGPAIPALPPDDAAQAATSELPTHSDGSAAPASTRVATQASRSIGQPGSVGGPRAGSASLPREATSGPRAVPRAESAPGPGAVRAAGAPARPDLQKRESAVRAASLHRSSSTCSPAAELQSLLDPGVATAWGGFLFVLNLWRLRPPDDGATALAWLHALATGLSVAPGDGLMALLQSLQALEPATQPLPLRHLREQALHLTRLPLRCLLAGPGIVRASTTHIDIHLPLRSARLAVRRAGLDLDPGWQPLLQRVVSFHYESN